MAKLSDDWRVEAVVFGEARKEVQCCSFTVNVEPNQISKVNPSATRHREWKTRLGIEPHFCPCSVDALVDLRLAWQPGTWVALCNYAIHMKYLANHAWGLFDKKTLSLQQESPFSNPENWLL
jgi:hypothetical protein